MNYNYPHYSPGARPFNASTLQRFNVFRIASTALFLLSLLWSLVTSPAANEPSAWWMRPQRMIQTNLREIDAGMDLEAYIAKLKEARANVVLFNVGGIVANYPTDLPFHYRNPFMKGDFTGEVVKRLHAAGIKMIARFDFSKINESIARQHPEWLSRDTQGQSFPAYNGQVPTCLNSGYQQEGMFQILSEAIDRYPLDGVFFNMIGYPRNDYSGRDLGLCQCQGCRERFKQATGLDLPRSLSANSEVTRQYESFCRQTISDQFQRVNRLVKGKNPHLVICTYTPEGVDLIRSESNTPHGQWTYEDSEKARRTLLAHPDKMLANTAVHFIHYPQRHASVSPHLTQRRILQMMLNGAWLDFYCIGPWHTLEDRLGQDEVLDLFQFHADNEHWLLDTVAMADIGLVADPALSREEYRGLYKILAESHRSFALVSLERSELKRFLALVVPVMAPLRPSLAQRLDDYVQQGGRLLLAGPVPSELKCTGIEQQKATLPQTQGTYIRIRPEDKQRLRAKAFNKLDLVYLEGELRTYQVSQDTETFLRYIPAAMFGPPEKCYYTNVSEIPCLFYRKYGEGAVAWFPWPIGTHYERQGHAGHAALVTAALDHLLTVPARVRIEASPLVEINHRAGRDNSFEWVSLINHSGLLEKVLHAPTPMRQITIEIKPQKSVTAVRLLRTSQPLEFSSDGPGMVRCVVPELKEYEVVVFVQ